MCIMFIEQRSVWGMDCCPGLIRSTRDQVNTTAKDTFIIFFFHCWWLIILDFLPRLGLGFKAVVLSVSKRFGICFADSQVPLR